MESIIALIILLMFATLVAWVLLHHLKIWNWIKLLVKVALNPVKKLLLIVVRKIKWVIVKIEQALM